MAKQKFIPLRDVKSYLSQGLGVEDIALRANTTLRVVRIQVDKLRQRGELEMIYHNARQAIR